MPAVANLTDQVIIPQNQVIIPSVFQSPSIKNYLEYKIISFIVNLEENVDINENKICAPHFFIFLKIYVIRSIRSLYYQVFIPSLRVLEINLQGV